jgi:hypothetical protein
LGQLNIPDVVCDANSTPVKLASLNDGRTKTHLEPPPLGLSAETPELELGENIPQWGE